MTAEREHADELGFEHVFEAGTSEWTLLLLHGTGGDEHDLLELGRHLAPGANLLSPRGKVLENGMPRFFRRLAVGQLDIPDLINRTDELAQFVDRATDVYALDKRRVLALGLSNGANIAVSVLLRHPGLLRAAALLRPILAYEPEQSPQLDGTDVLIASGSEDPYSSAEQSARLAQVLSDAGARVSTHVEPGAGHHLTQNELSQLRLWIAALIDPGTAETTDGAPR